MVQPQQMMMMDLNFSLSVSTNSFCCNNMSIACDMCMHLKKLEVKSKQKIKCLRGQIFLLYSGGIYSGGKKTFSHHHATLQLSMST